jgi:hypothetical protein
LVLGEPRQIDIVCQNPLIFLCFMYHLSPIC